MSPEDIKRFQSTHHDWLGKPLVVDGLLGEKTLWAIAISTLPQWRQDVVFAACDDVGKAEEGDNGGPWVEARQKAVNAKKGDPWCAAAGSYWLSFGGLRKGSASALSLVRMLNPVTWQEVLPGDAMAYPTDDTGHGHFTIIIGKGVGEMATVEGNQRNAVRALRRKLAPDMLFGTLETKIVVAGVSPKLELVNHVGATR